MTHILSDRARKSKHLYHHCGKDRAVLRKFMLASPYVCVCIYHIHTHTYILTKLKHDKVIQVFAEPQSLSIQGFYKFFEGAEGHPLQIKRKNNTKLNSKKPIQDLELNKMQSALHFL